MLYENDIVDRAARRSNFNDLIADSAMRGGQARGSRNFAWEEEQEVEKNDDRNNDDQQDQNPVGAEPMFSVVEAF